ncbi:T9SS type B sorting domain-containing protein [Flavobacterium sp. TP390]|uniref:T9SS type B sorting domain-containing protein n=1 Tax=Flavobacterium profundi TaxID=1774945 RepID=A0A6I4IGL8_9FLAO|nr:T9SS type B sorting domain-containing protein [Flavobacterium profundi]MVO08843.1 T9SS type B sorting domain-containing protein [Flavobacterium profundi]
MKNNYFLTTFLLFITLSFAQNLPNDCQNYIQACDNQSVSFDVSGAGVQEINPPSCSSQENNSLWLRVTIDQPGTLGFTIIPQSGSINEDYDFWVFGPASTCGNLGAPIRCSTTNPAAAGLTNNHTGLNASSFDTSEGPGPSGDSFVRELNVLSGESYFVVIDRPVGSSPFSLNWNGTATILNPFANLNFPAFPDVVLCDEGNDNIELYDFSILDASYLSGFPGFFITYFASLQDASLNNNPLIGSTNISQGTYYARINSVSAQCTEIKPITVIFDAIIANDFATIVCENNATASIDYNLSTHNTQLYSGGQAVSFSYYNSLVEATSSSNAITNWQNINLNVGTHTFYVRVEKGTCFDIAELSIEVVERPIINNVVNLKQCDDDTDGFSAFNLTEANELISSSITGLTFTYFLNLTDAENNTNPIVNDINFINQTVNVQTIYYRVSNSNGCYRTGQLDLTVAATQVPASFNPILITECDDTFGDNNDGIAQFSLVNASNQISNLFTGQIVQVTFYENIDDALAEINAITNLSSYTNTSSPNFQELFVRVDSNINNDCVGLGKYVALQVEGLPIVTEKILRGCDDNHDGIVEFDTTTVESQFLSELSNTNVAVTYTDANNVVYTALPNPFPSGSQTLTVALTNSTPNACTFSTTLEFIVYETPIINPVDPNLLVACETENPLNQDGIEIFDTSSFENTIIGIQTNVDIAYFDTNNNPIPNFIGTYETGTQDVLVVLRNSNNTACETTEVLSFVVNSRPIINTQSMDEVICTDDPNSSVILNAGLVDENTINDFTYQWYLDNQAITNANQYTFQATTIGDYSVEVVNSLGCSSTRTIQVNPSNIATIEDIDIVDLEENNTVTVLVTGDGDYQYSIDGENYQDSPVFYDVLPGTLTVYVYDLNGCGISNESISVLGIPQFFTPNGDGINDFWNVKGFDSRFGSQTTISIFDRYGKLIKQISSSSPGWDGTFNNVDLPATDYWYTIDMIDGRVQKGHFSLKR